MDLIVKNIRGTTMINRLVVHCNIVLEKRFRAIGSMMILMNFNDDNDSSISILLVSLACNVYVRKTLFFLVIC